MYQPLRHTLAALVLALATAGLARADLLPPPEPGEPPPGPDKVTLRGLELDRHFGYSRGHHWMVTIGACPTTKPACDTLGLVGCEIVKVEGRELAADTAVLLAADRATTAQPLGLDLACSAGDRSIDIEADGTILPEVDGNQSTQ